MTQGRPLWLQLVGAERGALLWIPGLWVVAALVLFAILQASAEGSLFNHTRDFRLALGPMDLVSAAPDEGLVFTAALRGGLTAKRELTLVEDDVVRSRVQDLLGAPLPADPRRWMRATRSLNVSVYLMASLRQAEGQLHASVALWSVGDEAEFARFSARDDRAEPLGRALADSVGQALFAPQVPLHGSR